MPYTYTYGSGTVTDPYQIWNIDDLNGIRDYIEPGHGNDYINVHFEQRADIDLNGINWIPFGWYYDDIAEEWKNAAFQSHYNGNSYQINNLTINDPDFSSYLGLFSYIYGGQRNNPHRATIRNIIIKNANINVSGGVYGGVLVGYATKKVIVDNCHVINSSISGNYIIGGLVGLLSDTHPLEEPDAPAKVMYCSFNGNVSGFYDLGGFCGQNYGGETINSYCNSGVNLLAYTNPEHSHWNIGGFTGLNADGSEESCYANGEIILHSEPNSINAVGGYVGQNYGEIKNCFTRTKINATHADKVGGFVGILYDDTIEHCYNANEISGGTTVGGFCGEFYEYSIIINSYYNSELTGQSDTDKGTPKTTLEMTYPYSNPETIYVNWDFDEIWRHDKGEQQ